MLRPHPFPRGTCSVTLRVDGRPRRARFPPPAPQSPPCGSRYGPLQAAGHFAQARPLRKLGSPRSPEPLSVLGSRPPTGELGGVPIPPTASSPGHPEACGGHWLGGPDISFLSFPASHLHSLPRLFWNHLPIN